MHGLASLRHPRPRSVDRLTFVLGDAIDLSGNRWQEEGPPESLQIVPSSCQIDPKSKVRAVSLVLLIAAANIMNSVKLVIPLHFTTFFTLSKEIRMTYARIAMRG